MTQIIAENLSKDYGNGDSMVRAISGLSFEIETGEFVGIMGESGAGKSTLLSIMGALNSPTTGRYIVNDIDVYGLNGEQRADFRREFLGFIFQSFHLIPYLTVMENVMLPLTTIPMPRKKKHEMAAEALDCVGLTPTAKRLPRILSGGEQERVAIARAIVNQPTVLLADEPTGNLDSRNSDAVMHLLQRLNTAGTTIIMVTHSNKCARYAQRILNVADGRLTDTPAAGVEINNDTSDVQLKERAA
ncbi:MAG: ABC transporter ATP-binding protein [Desulfobacteraceae bacterium]|nr:ABC transporter ATP-binding protein [Desulfobacteraceae bacterium]